MIADVETEARHLWLAERPDMPDHDDLSHARVTREQADAAYVALYGRIPTDDNPPF